MSREVDPAELVTGIDPVVLEEGDLVESVIVIVKVSDRGGTSTLHRHQTPGLSYWESLGMLYDALEGERQNGQWRPADGDDL